MKTRHSTTLRLLAILLTLTASSAACAEAGTQEPIWRFGGFGTLGAGYHGSDGLTYRRDLEQAGGHDGGRLGFRGDSRIGVQASASFDARWSAQIQSVSRLDSEGKWTPQLSWTFLRYTPSDTLDMRIGRLGVDLYLDGDSRHVGYAFTTVRPAPEVLGVVTQDLFDGVDVTARHPAGAGLLSLRLYGGRSRGDLSLYGSQYRPPDARRLGATLDWVSEGLTLRAAWGDTYTSQDTVLQPLASALLSAPFPLARARGAQFDTSHHLTFAGLGFLYEQGPFSAQGMFSWSRFSQFPTYRGQGANVTLAYRVGAFKPYLTYSNISFDPKEPRDLSLPAPYAALQSAYDRAVDRLTMNQRSIGVGVRYDFARDYALKFQVDRINAAESILIIDSRGMPARDVGMTLYSITLDFVF
ncbi:signal protein [Methyloversatilis sp.]|uniref:signal protein n=1 Tax=Methyloversatilis sp. TaxID=2569862 RepID=UPI003F70A911